MARVRIEEYGCAASKADSEMIAGLLASSGHEITHDERDAEVNVMVTCSVKDATAKRMMHRMGKLSSGKLVVAGCMAKAEPQTVSRFAPRASVIGPSSISQIGAAVDATMNGQQLVALDGTDQKIGLPKIRLNSEIGIVEIASGCMSECSFCQTKLAKGGLESYRIGDIVRQVRAEVRDGCREIWLTSTDNGCYGYDIGTNLPELLRAIHDIDGDYNVRVGMMNPMYMNRILEDLADAIAEDPRIYRFLHIPVQSGSDDTLGDMKRAHTAQTFADACRILRGRFGKFTIATDIIVGYPTETVADFKRTVQLLEETRPDVINLSKYSSRPGTEGAALRRLDESETKRRSRIIHDLAGRIALENNKGWIGWRGRVAFSERTQHGVAGRNYAYKQIVLDGAEIGKSADVEIADAQTHCLIGTESS